jgi:hypothetical protein
MRTATLAPTQAYSAASIGRAWLKAMGIRPILQRQTDFPKIALGAAMGAYYGGRTECRIRRVPVPVVYVDFLSMYPTACTLMKLWRLLTCERIAVEDATEEVQRLLDTITLNNCLNPAKWTEFVGFVQFVPQGDIVPCRAPYGGPSQWQIGTNPLWFDEALWYTIPCAVASKLLTGRAPRLAKAIRLVPQGTSPDIQPVLLRGAIRVDPRTDDFFKVVIEERKRINARTYLAAEERERLDRFLKVLANSTSYGIFVEMRRHELPPGEKESITIHGIDDEPFTADVIAPEEPGEHTFPPLGALISGAGRLMLAILERLVTDARGFFAFCDTDSMSIVATKQGGLTPCPGGPERLTDGREAVRALPWEDVERIRQQFAALNPYDQDAVHGSILKLEDVNFDPINGNRRQLYCYAISSKRYALFVLDSNGRPVLRDRQVAGHEEPIQLSEHGLGHLLNPTDPEDESRDWITIIWGGIITEALGLLYEWPQWLGRPAASRLTVSTWRQLELFAELNQGKSYSERIKPANFLLTFHVAPFGHPTGVDPEHFHLFAPWNPEARQWMKMIGVDQYTGKKFRVSTIGFTGSEGVARVKTYGDVLAEYRVHPEPKSLGPDGEPCNRGTVGLLRRRSVTGIYIDYVGKESNRLEEVQAGTVHDPGEVLTIISHPRRGAWPKLILRVLQEIPVADLARASARSYAVIKRIRAGQKPNPELVAPLTRAAGEFARQQLAAWNHPTPKDDLAACFAYLSERGCIAR